MPEPSLIESYLAAMRLLLKASPAEVDRILEEAEDHLSQSVLQGVESGLSLREAEENAITRFGLPREVCGRFRQVYRPWRRRPFGLPLAAVLGVLVLGAFSMESGRFDTGVVLAMGLIPGLLGFLPAYIRRSARAGIVPGLATCAVSFPLWLWCAFVSPGWYRDPVQRPPLNAMGIEFITDLLLMASLFVSVTAGAAFGAWLRRRGPRLA